MFNYPSAKNHDALPELFFSSFWRFFSLSKMKADDWNLLLILLILDEKQLHNFQQNSWLIYLWSWATTEEQELSRIRVIDFKKTFQIAWLRNTDHLPEKYGIF